MKHNVLTIIFVFASALLTANTTMAQSTIQKCQDADGKWHYGDYAADACAQSIIESMDGESGLKTGEEGLPPTKEEQEAQAAAEAAEEAEKENRVEQRARENRILAIYESEEQIINARDQRVKAAMDSIEFNNTMKTRLQERLTGFEEQAKNESLKEKDRAALQERITALKSQIAAYDSATAAKEKEMQDIETHYNGDLEFYRYAKEQRAQGS
ncbi:MAG: hypothetical protein OER96_01455 [Gammaproteobacteria bacterium]|nr:hypothetical protein [Gammaproteobacteria bacterium]